MTPGQAALLAGAGFVAGTLNAVAGGGSLISFPALLAAGLGSVPANVTNTVALWPGYVGGAIGYRRELSQDRRQVVALCLTGLVGAAAGSVLLLTTPADVFTALVPWLVLAATALFALQPWVSAWVSRRARMSGRDPSGPPLIIGVLLASVYGAYFGAGLGIILLAVIGSLLSINLQQVNAYKNALSMSINTLAMVFFAIFGPVHWLPVLIMAATSLLGGFLGAKVARRLPAHGLRIAVIGFGTVVAIVLFVR
ncbi:sulfite exporter TauE/SafE family protein [Jatrophihabitans sp. DSM 45814]